METLRNIERHKLMVAIRTETPEHAYEAARACIDGGVMLVEITMSVPCGHSFVC
jgi:2-keto-3-deoxy-6-phosphogluconate aldolase